MEKKKALLVVAGGRATPDVLTLLCVQPELISILTSEDGWEDQAVFIEAAQSLPHQVEILPTVQVESFNLKACQDACARVFDIRDSVFKEYPATQWDWTFSIGSCPKVMAIAAYEVAKEKDIPCIYIDTRHEQIISLTKDIGVSSEKFFHMSVPDYMKLQNRTGEKHSQEKAQYRRQVEQWGHIAHVMASSSDTPTFASIMHDKSAKVPVTIPEALAGSKLLQDLENLQAIELVKNNSGETACQFTTSHFAKFLGTGDWLEVYVWAEACKIDFADDCRWGYKIKSSADNELDVVLTYKAQLILAECKARKEPFDTKHLDWLSAKAEMLGRTYVTKVFITNAPKNQKGYKNFAAQAILRQIVVVTFEELKNIGKRLEQEAKHPTYRRI